MLETISSSGERGDFWICGLRFDEATQYVCLDPSAGEIWYRWLLDALNTDAALTCEDRERIAACLSEVPRYGHLRTFVERSSACWGKEGAVERSIFVSTPVGIQRGTASNLRGAMDRTRSPVTLQFIKERVAQKVRVCWLAVLSDSASANERLFAEFADELSPFPNIILLWLLCWAHQCGIMENELVDRTGLINPLFSLSKLLQCQDYAAQWKSGMSMFIMSHGQFSVFPTSPARAEIDRVASACHLQRIANFTVLREWRVTAATHIASPQPSNMPAEVRQRQEAVDHLAIYWQVKLNMHTRCHMCGGPDSVCGCQSERHALHNAAEAALAIIGPMLPTSSPASNRWQSMNAILSVLTFSILLGCVGPEGWLWSYPLQKAHRYFQENEGSDDVFKRVSSVRLMAVSKKMGDMAFKVSITFACVVSLPVDQLLRFLLKADSMENHRHRTHPLIFDLTSPLPSNPIRHCLHSLAAEFDVGSDSLWLLDFWTGDARARFAGESFEQFRQTWQRRLVQMLLHQLGAVFYRLWLMVLAFPLKLFSIPSACHFLGEDSSEAMQAIMVVLGACRQCWDPACTEKFLRLALLPTDLLPSKPLGASLKQAAWECGVANGDCERDNAEIRQTTRVGVHAPYLSTVCTYSGVRTIALEHQARGGTLPQGLSSDAIRAAGLATQRKRKATTQHPKKCRAFILYWNHKQREWKEQQRQQQGPAQAAQPGNPAAPQRKRLGKKRNFGSWASLQQAQKRWRREWGKPWNTCLRTYWANQAARRRAQAVAEACSPVSRGATAACPPGAAAACPPASMGAKADDSFASLWGLGSRCSPLNEEIIAGAIEKYSAGQYDRKQVQVPGAVVAGRKIAESQSFMVADPQSHQGKLPTIERRLTCHERHAGICRNQMGQWADVMFSAVCNLNTMCSNFTKWQLIGRIARMRALVAGVWNDLDVIFCDVRFSRPKAQIFCPMQGGGETRALRRDEQTGIALGTSFSLVHGFLTSLQCGRADLQALTFQELHSSCVCEGDEGAAAFRVWVPVEADKGKMMDGQEQEIWPSMLPRSRRCGRRQARDLLHCDEGDEIDKAPCSTMLVKLKATVSAADLFIPGPPNAVSRTEGRSRGQSLRNICHSNSSSRSSSRSSTSSVWFSSIRGSACNHSSNCSSYYSCSCSSSSSYYYYPWLVQSPLRW